MNQIHDHTPDTSAPTAETIFPGNSEMAQLMRTLDWSQTPLGPVERWSPSLRMMVSFLLANRFPLLLWWGPQFCQLYNDPYRPVLGSKHPASMGQPASQCFPEIWDVIGPLIETPFTGGPSTWSEDLFLEVYRHGFTEETHFTVAYSPVPDDTAPHQIGGVLATVHEITEKVIADRRVILLRDLAARSAEAKTAEEACQIAAETLTRYPKDLPFAMLYLLDSEGEHARLAASAGVKMGTRFSPRTQALHLQSGNHSDGAHIWPLAEAVRTEAIQFVDRLATRFDHVPPGPWSDPPESAVVVPIRSNIAHHLAGLLVVGISSRLRFDDIYAGFLELVCGQISTAIANARAYEQERQRAEALAEIDRAKTTFFSNVSHEFRTPLTLILGPLEDSLADPNNPPSPQQRERLEVMRRSSLRLLKLVNALLDFARIEAGRAQAVYRPTDLAATTEELASAFRSLVERAGLNFEVDCPPLPNLLEPVYVDREMWEKIVFNLLSNAFKFTFTGTITIALRAINPQATHGASVELVVRDTGTGVPSAEIPLLFERFHRVEGARSRTYEGSGIGLALVQELVQLHGGTIRVESIEGHGTAFFVRLPVGADHLPADQIASVGAPSTLTSTAVSAAAYIEEAERWLPDGLLEEAFGNLDGETPLLTLNGARDHSETDREEVLVQILIADDNADMREYLRRLLGEHYSVEAVANGVEALAVIQRSSPLPDLVLADVMMPELDGFGLLRELRSNPRTAALPVMILSARAGQEATVEGLQAGADDYLVKPFSAREILSRVAARLEIARTRAESEQRTRRALNALLHLAQTLFNAPQEQAPEESPSSAAMVDDPHGEVNPRAEYEIAHRLATLTCDLLGCTRVGIQVVEPTSEVLRAVAVVGLPKDQEIRWWAEQRAYEAQGVRLGEGGDPDEVARFREGEVFMVDMTLPPYDALPNSYGVTTSLIAPMRAAERVVGVLSLDFGGPPHPFTDDERALTKAVAQLGAAALERTRLLHANKAATARELAALEARRQMDDFLGIATHELRTPLTSITANVQMALRRLKTLSLTTRTDHLDLDDDNQHSLSNQLKRSALLLERTDRQVGRLDRLIGDLIDASRIQADRLELRQDLCDLLEIVRDAALEQRSSWPGRAIFVQFPHQAVAPVMADADRIGQVITNFLTNALKYSPDDAEVVVTVERNDEEIRVEVRDHGPGLTEEQQEHLFERFYRAPGIEQQSGSGVGLGLGLYICKTIIQRHDGAIGVESTPGEGSTFWFTLRPAQELLAERNA